MPDNEPFVGAFSWIRRRTEQTLTISAQVTGPEGLAQTRAKASRGFGDVGRPVQLAFSGWVKEPFRNFVIRQSNGTKLKYVNLT